MGEEDVGGPLPIFRFMMGEPGDLAGGKADGNRSTQFLGQLLRLVRRGSVAPQFCRTNDGTRIVEKDGAVLLATDADPGDPAQIGLFCQLLEDLDDRLPPVIGVLFGGTGG